MKYRLKSNLVDAVQFLPENYASNEPLPIGVKKNETHPKGPTYFEPTDGAPTEYCTQLLSGMWLVYDGQKRSVMTDAAFNSLYEPVPQE